MRKRQRLIALPISGSLVGNIKLDNAEVSYNIQGDILADRFNLDKQVEVAIKQLEDPKH